MSIYTSIDAYFNIKIDFAFIYRDISYTFKKKMIHIYIPFFLRKKRNTI